MSTHKAVQVPAANEALTVVEVDTVSPPPGHVRLDMAACGVCGTDREFHAGHFPGLQWPLTLGHEIAGTVAEVGDAVEDFAVVRTQESALGDSSRRENAAALPRRVLDRQSVVRDPARGLSLKLHVPLRAEAAAVDV